jgi:hypothetical protein
MQCHQWIGYCSPLLWRLFHWRRQYYCVLLTPFLEIELAKPSKVIGVKPLPRKCGHIEDFSVHEKDPFLQARMDKHLTKNCAACNVAAQGENAKKQKAKAQQNQTPATPKKSKLPPIFANLPIGTAIMMMRCPNGLWTGRIGTAPVEQLSETVHAQDLPLTYTSYGNSENVLGCLRVMAQRVLWPKLTKKTEDTVDAAK